MTKRATTVKEIRELEQKFLESEILQGDFIKEKRIERTAEITGKKYKQWVHVGTGRLPNFEEMDYKIKGDWLVVDNGYEVVRYLITEED